MKLIKPNFEIITQNPNNDGMLKHIELCGRVCYKSEDKIKDNTAAIFVNGLIKSGHTSVLEHGTVYLKVNVNQRDTYFKYCANKYSKTNSIGEAETTINDYKRLRENPNLKWFGFITTNYRVLVENKWLDDLQYQCDPTEFHEKRVTVKFICDRGISHEFVRHRVFSFSQESTRYCNYSKDKFTNEITFIEPFWIKDIPVKYYTRSPESLFPSERCDSAAKFLYQLELIEETYFELIEEGWKPEQARNILPNSLKTELMMTGFVTDWKHFFELRCSKAAHPQAQELAIPLEEEFKKLNLI